jgi:hypothetical protein
VQSDFRTARHGDAPLRRRCQISDCPPSSNQEAPFPQARGTLFDRLLRKKHAISTRPCGRPEAAALPAISVVFTDTYAPLNARSAWRIRLLLGLPGSFFNLPVSHRGYTPAVLQRCILALGYRRLSDRPVSTPNRPQATEGRGETDAGSPGEPNKPPSMRPQEKDGPRYDARLLERARPRPPEKISDIFFGPNPAEPRATADARTLDQGTRDDTIVIAHFLVIARSFKSSDRATAISSLLHRRQAARCRRTYNFLPVDSGIKNTLDRSWSRDMSSRAAMSLFIYYEREKRLCSARRRPHS